MENPIPTPPANIENLNNPKPASDALNNQELPPAPFKKSLLV